jgi:predicted ATPase
VEAGLRVLAEALAVVQNTGECFWEAELHRLQGALLLQQAVSPTPTAEAEVCLQRLLDVARRQQARSLELRAALSLARLWQRQGKHETAYQLWAVYTLSHGTRRTRLVV